MEKVLLYKDEVYPVYFIDEDTRYDMGGVVVAMDAELLREVKEVKQLHYEMQKKLKKLFQENK